MRLLTAALIAAALAGPALAAERCLIADRIDDFRDASRDAVTLSASGKDYRVTFIASCVGLDTAISVAAVSHTTCFEAGDTLRFQDASGFGQRCIANTVTYIEKNAPEPATAP